MVEIAETPCYYVMLHNRISLICRESEYRKYYITVLKRVLSAGSCQNHWPLINLCQ